MTRSRLHARRRKLTQQAPDLAQLVRGSLFERTRRCGRPTCHCADGPGHTTTYLGVTLTGGKSVQITVPDEWLPVVKTWTDNYARLAQLIEEVSAINRELLRERLLSAPEQQPRLAPRRGKAR